MTAPTSETLHIIKPLSARCTIFYAISYAVKKRSVTASAPEYLNIMKLFSARCTIFKQFPIVLKINPPDFHLEIRGIFMY